MENELPFSQACENNKTHILSVLKKHLALTDYVLEIGSGTGQHAVYFGEKFPHLIWQPADRNEHLEGITRRIEQAQLSNVRPPLELDVNQPWPIENAQAVFSANTVHIMSWQEVERLISQLGCVLESKGVFCLYGPFNREGRYTSESNARFDQWLKGRDPQSGIRDFEAIRGLAQVAGLQLIDDYEMPANNSCLVFYKN